MTGARVVDLEERGRGARERVLATGRTVRVGSALSALRGGTASWRALPGPVPAEAARLRTRRLRPYTQRIKRSQPALEHQKVAAGHDDDGPLPRWRRGGEGAVRPSSELRT